MYTVVAENMAPHYIAQNVNPHSTTPTSLRAADILHNSEPNAITSPSYSYINYYIQQMVDDGQS
jgi:hypothetical protein